MFRKKTKVTRVDVNFNVNEYAYLSIAVMVGGQILCTGIDTLGRVIATGISSKAKPVAKKSATSAPTDGTKSTQ